MAESVPDYSLFEFDEHWQLVRRIVQPVFTLEISNLPWCLDSDQNDAPERSVTLNDTVRRIQSEMITLPELAPRYHLPRSTYYSCRTPLWQLCNALERVIDEAVLGIPVDEEAANESHISVTTTHGWAFSMLRPLDWLTKAMRDMMTRKGPDTTRVPAAPTRRTANIIALSTPDCPNLKALARLAHQGRYRAQYLKLVHPLAVFKDLESCAKALKKSFIGIRDAVQPSREIPDIKLEQFTHWEKSCQLLFDRLQTQTSSCIYHEAMLQVRIKSLEEAQKKRTTQLRVLVSSCPDVSLPPELPPHPHWREGLFTYVETEEKDQKIILALCKYVKDSEMREVYPDLVLDITFTRFGFFRPASQSTQAGVRQEAWGSLSLAHLLRKKVLSDEQFPSKRKAELALSIGRYLLHLFSSSWMLEEWTAETIHFPYSIDPGDEGCGIKHPYISCTLSANDCRDRATNMKAEDCNPYLWAFAGVLLEIEKGEGLRIDLAEDDNTLRAIVWRELSRLENGVRGSRITHYIQAIHGCVDFAAVLSRSTPTAATLQREHFKYKELQKSKYQLQHVRQVIYSQIVKHLEYHYDSVPADADDGDYGNFLFKLPRTSFNVAINRQEPPSHALCTFSSSDATPSTLIAKYATEFERLFKQFLRRFIKPKMTHAQWPNTRTRIKIALLDTGYRARGSDFEARCGDAMMYRKDQGFPRDECKPIKGEWHHPDDKDIDDSCGHGTQLACLLLKYAPDADLYIAKVSSGMEFDAKNVVADAIRWAAGPDVGADIISISFGLDDGNDSIDSAIDDAMESVSKAGSRPLIFAAASNHGLNKRQRSFPASDPRVICAYALDGNGNDSSGMNPPFEDDQPNFGTFGHSVKGKWANKDLAQSGTSYSTPIMAAITANYLDWLGHYKEILGERKYQRLRRKDEIEHFLKVSGVKKQTNGRIWSVAPWHWLEMKPDNVKEKEEIPEEVEDQDKKVEAQYVSKLCGRWQY